jgi:hypothetical protein
MPYFEEEKMADCNKEFSQFLEKIQLRKTKIEYLRTSRDALRERIKTYYKEKGENVPDFLGQGSFKAHTCINQIDEDYDIDDGVYLQHLPENKDDWPKTETVHGEIKEAVKEHTDQPPEDKTTCVRVRFKKEYHVDLAIYGEFENKVYLARKGNEQWEENSPRLFTEWILGKIKSQGEQLRNVIKYIKKWAYYNGWIDSISGFFITILVGNHFSPAGERDDLALSNTLANMADYLRLNRKIIRPVVPMKSMTASFTDDEMDTMISHFEKFRDQAQKAVAGITSKKDAQETWLSLFGDDFPKYADDEQIDNSLSISRTKVRENKPWGN